MSTSMQGFARYRARLRSPFLSTVASVARIGLGCSWCAAARAVATTPRAQALPGLPLPWSCPALSLSFLIPERNSHHGRWTGAIAEPPAPVLSRARDSTRLPPVCLTARPAVQPLAQPGDVFPLVPRFYLLLARQYATVLNVTVLLNATDDEAAWCLARGGWQTARLCGTCLANVRGAKALHVRHLQRHEIDSPLPVPAGPA